MILAACSYVEVVQICWMIRLAGGGVTVGDDSDVWVGGLYCRVELLVIS